MSLLIFHIQATSAFDLESIFQFEAKAYILFLQAKLEYNLRGFLQWTYGNETVLLLSYPKTRNFKLNFWFRCWFNIVVN